MNLNGIDASSMGAGNHANPQSGMREALGKAFTSLGLRDTRGTGTLVIAC